MATLQTQLLLPHQARPLADILLKFISKSKAGPHGASVLPVTLTAVIEQVKKVLAFRAKKLSPFVALFFFGADVFSICFGRLFPCWLLWQRVLQLRRVKILWLWRMLRR